MEHPWPYRKFHSCTDPDGGGVRPPPPENSQVIWVSIENSIWIPHPGKSWNPWKMVDPPPWINDGTIPETWEKFL